MFLKLIIESHDFDFRLKNQPQHYGAASEVMTHLIVGKIVRLSAISLVDYRLKIKNTYLLLYCTFLSFVLL